IFRARFHRRGDLHRRKTGHDLLDRPGLAAPGEHDAGRDTVATRNICHLGARYQRFLDDPRLVVLRPAPPPLQPVQHLDPHSLMTLKLDLRSHASRNTPRQTRRCSSEPYSKTQDSDAETRLKALGIAVRILI